MGKKFLQEIKNIISETYDIEYTTCVKSTLYTIGYIKYLNRFLYKSNFSEFIGYYMNNYNNYCIEDISLFNEHSCFRFESLKIEHKIIYALYDMKDFINIDEIDIANMYDFLMQYCDKKHLGQVYTPKKVVEYIVNSIFDEKKIDLSFKILDPACGSGYFLQSIIKKLTYMIEKENIINGTNEQIVRYVVENMVYGVDIDSFAIFLAKLSLTFQTGISNLKYNIIKKDFLFDKFGDIKFDVIMGNPPYVGHKKNDKSYFIKLKKIYSEVFYDKSDLSYCFFKASKENIKDDGVICYLTSRYFLEAKYADKLRRYLNNNFVIKRIYDFNGKNIFKNTMISPLIITLILRNNSHKDIKYKIHIKKYNYSNCEFDDFYYDSNKLDHDNGWFFMNEQQKKLYDKIQTKCNFRLGDICKFKQGIITGYDKAFVVNDEIIEKYNIEKNLLRKWIKNSSIKRDKINFKGLYLIYSNLIDDVDNYPNAIAYLSNYKERLKNRRECINGRIKWYHLQWARDINLFQCNKIIFPYKSSNNVFYLDKENYFCSADVYMMFPTEEIYVEYLTKYLNSSIFEYVFKSIAKKVGENLYEYYPNKLEKAMIFIPKESDLEKIIKMDKKSLENYLYKLFNISVGEQIIIKYK